MWGLYEHHAANGGYRELVCVAYDTNDIQNLVSALAPDRHFSMVRGDEIVWLGRAK